MQTTWQQTNDLIWLKKIWRLIGKSLGVYIYIACKDKNRKILLVQEFVCVTKHVTVENEDLKTNVITGKIFSIHHYALSQ